MRLNPATVGLGEMSSSHPLPRLQDTEGMRPCVFLTEVPSRAPLFLSRSEATIASRRMSHSALRNAHTLCDCAAS